MFKNEDDLKTIVSRLNIDDKPNPGHRESLRGQMLSAFNKSGEQPETESSSLWRTIMKSPIGKVAAAAAIVTIALFLLSHFTGSSNIAPSALAKVVEAVQKESWMHSVIVFNQAGESDVMESWVSFESQVEIEKESGGRVAFYDYKKQKQHVYNPTIKTITVTDLENGAVALGTSGPLELFNKLIQLEKDKGAKVEHKRTKSTETYEVIMSGDKGIEVSVLKVDVQTYLPTALEVSFTEHNGQLLYTARGNFDYPKRGPSDIFDLGVPRTAKIIDTREIVVAETKNEPKLVATPKPTAGPEMVPLAIKLPRAMFVGTPQDIKVARLEKPLGKPRPPFFAPVGTKNIAFGKEVSSTDEEPIIGEIEMITDGDKEGSDGSYAELGPFKQHVTIDLGAEHDIYAIVVWHFHKQPRVYFDVVVQVASEPNFVKPKAVFNNDIDNSLKFGVGKNRHYVETSEGKLIDAKGSRGRYVRLYSKGNTHDDLNHYIEVEVYGKAATDKPESAPDDEKRRSDNGEVKKADPNIPKTGMVPLQIKLPTPLFIGTPQNVQVPYLKKPLGKPRPSFYAPIGTKNVALGTPVFSTDEEPFIGEIEMITDGDKEGADGSFVELGLFKQHVTIDLEAEYNIYAIVIWHYHKQAWVFFDVAVQVGDEPDFITNVKTLFNNDIDNSLGLGVGKDMHYTETAEGKLIDAKGTVARYVRLYSNGSTGGDVNYYIEVEVYGKAAK